jgi:hypothetical protein
VSHRFRRVLFTLVLLAFCSALSSSCRKNDEAQQAAQQQDQQHRQKRGD